MSCFNYSALFLLVNVNKQMFMECLHYSFVYQLNGSFFFYLTTFLQIT